MVYRGIRVLWHLIIARIWEDLAIKCVNWNHFLHLHTTAVSIGRLLEERLLLLSGGQIKRSPRLNMLPFKHMTFISIVSSRTTAEYYYVSASEKRATESKTGFCQSSFLEFSECVCLFYYWNCISWHSEYQITIMCNLCTQ